MGGCFVWGRHGGPLLLVAGGSGVVPLMAMVRHRAARGSEVDTRLLFSSRGWDDIIYRDELQRLTGDGLTVVHTLTRVAAARLGGLRAPDRRGMLAEVARARAAPAHLRLRADAIRRGVAEALVQLGHEPQRDQDRALRTDGKLRWTN